MKSSSLRNHCGLSSGLCAIFRGLTVKIQKELQKLLLLFTTTNNNNNYKLKRYNQSSQVNQPFSKRSNLKGLDHKVPGMPATQRCSRSQGESVQSTIRGKDNLNTICSNAISTDALAATVTPYEDLQTEMKSDRRIIEYENLIHSSEYYAERRSNSNLVNRKDVDRLLKSCHVDKDPLVHWMNYIEYVKERYPFDEETMWRTHHRCVCALVHHEQYKIDQRFVRLCAIYADHCQDSLKTFKYLRKMNVGVSLAMMWMAWAWVAEKGGEYSLTRDIFRKAFEKKAKPMNVVKKRFKSFQRRMKRRDEELGMLIDEKVSGSGCNASRSFKCADRTSEHCETTGSNDVSGGVKAGRGRYLNEVSAISE